MPSPQKLRRSPFEDKPDVGVDAWLGTEKRPGHVQDASDVRGVPSVQDKIVRTAGPKWSPELLQQARDAVLCLRQQAGRPTMTLTEALDEAVETWLDEMRKQHNRGEAFSRRGGLR